MTYKDTRGGQKTWFYASGNHATPQVFNKLNPLLSCVFAALLKDKDGETASFQRISFRKWSVLLKSLFQFSSVAQSCPTLLDPMDCSTPGLPVHHQLPEFTQTHVDHIGDAIQPSHLLSSLSPPTFHLAQNQGLFLCVCFKHSMKVQRRPRCPPSAHPVPVLPACSSQPGRPSLESHLPVRPLYSSHHSSQLWPLPELSPTLFILSFPGGSEVKASACDVRDRVRSLDREDSLE